MSVFVAFLLASASATPAQPAVDVPTAAPAPVKPAKEKKICKADPEADPGSHMIKRICRTQREWDEQPGVMGSSRSGFSTSGESMQGH